MGWEWGAEPKGGWERSWIWGDPKKVEKPSAPEVSKRAGGSSEPRNRPGRGWEAYDTERQAQALTGSEGEVGLPGL